MVGSTKHGTLTRETAVYYCNHFNQNLDLFLNITKIVFVPRPNQRQNKLSVRLENVLKSTHSLREIFICGPGCCGFFKRSEFISFHLVLGPY